MDTGKKLRGIRKQKGLNQSQLAKKLGVAQSLISALENNQRNLTEDVIDRFREAFPDIDVDFHSGIKEFPSKPGTGTLVNMEAVPIVPQFMQRDLADRMKNQSWYFELPRVVVDLPNGDYLAFDISGNQLLYDGKMAIFPGDIAVGQLIDIEKQWEDGKIYAVITSSNGVVIARMDKDIKRIIATPLNSLFGPVSIQQSEIHSIYRIIAIQSKRHAL